MVIRLRDASKSRNGPSIRYIYICCVPRPIWGRGKPSTGFKWWNFEVQTCCTCSGGPLQSVHCSVFFDFGFWARNTPSCGPGWPPGLPHGILCTRLQYVHIEAWYTGSFGVARIPAGYVLKNQNLKKLSRDHSDKGLKSVCKKKMVPKSSINNAWNIHP